jgi:hypothetical protein
MKIIVDGNSEQNQFTDVNAFNEYWKGLTKRIFSSNRFIRSIQIDGKPFYNDFDIHLLNHFHSVETLEIQTHNESELLAETLADIKKYMSKLVDAIDTVSNVFYGDLDESDWRLIGQFIEGVDWLFEAMTMSFDLMVKTKEGLDVQPHLQSAVQRAVPHLQSLDQLFQEKDYITIGDLIQYELKPIFIELHDALHGIG